MDAPVLERKSIYVRILISVCVYICIYFYKYICIYVDTMLSKLYIYIYNIHACNNMYMCRDLHGQTCASIYISDLGTKDSVSRQASVEIT